MTFTPLPGMTSLGSVTLAVRDLNAVSAFYSRIMGLEIADRTDGIVRLRVPGATATLIELEGHPHATFRPLRAPGLFHAAYLYPSRLELARSFRRMINDRVQFQGFADHGVSEAIYLADPEGNGIELYSDRPREEWSYSTEGLEMVTDPLDLDGLLAETAGDVRVTDGAPAGLTLGHVHLQVSNLDSAEQFWSSTIGFDVVQRNYPGALFVSAGGYHHHLGLNVWNSRQSQIPAGDITGLVRFSIHLPDHASLHALAQRIGASIEGTNLVQRDHDGIAVTFSTPA